MRHSGAKANAESPFQACYVVAQAWHALLPSLTVLPRSPCLQQGQRNSMVPFSPWAIVIQQIFSHHAVLNREDAGLRFMKALVASVPGYK